ncbi:hypothetical protein ACQJBY_014540 [Aegilops geniculata]
MNPGWEWVVDVENMLADDNPGSRRMEGELLEAQYVYRVPEWLKGMNTKAYHPRLVSLGPFHHGDSSLLPMEEHKRRALVHLIKRSNKPLQDFVSAINDVAHKLEEAYGKDLHVKWRNDRPRFVDVMLTDGCFLLEMMSRPFWDYELHDAVFSKHGRERIFPVIRSDMLLIENQLPLLVLKKILGVVRPNHSDAPNVSKKEAAMDRNINLRVLSFLGRAHEGRAIADVSLRLHPLELYHRSLTYDNGAHGVYSREYKYEMMPSALEIHEAGIKFRKSKTDKLLDIRFKRGVLSMPVMMVDDSTESLYLNLMAFERLHADAGDLVTAYVIFMDNIIVSADDVAMLSKNGVLKNMLGCDEETAKLFNGTLSRGQLLGPCHSLHNVQYEASAY